MEMETIDKTKEKEKEIVLWAFTDNIASSADAALIIKDNEAIIEVCGGFWSGTCSKVIVTKDKIIAIDSKGRRQEYPAPWL